VTVTGGDGAEEEAPRAPECYRAAIRDAFEQMPVLTAATDGPGHTVVAANAAFRAFAGQPGLVGRPARQAFSGLPGEQIAGLLDLVYATGESFTARDWPAAGERYLDITLTPWRGAGGAVRGLLVTQVDVTAQVRERPAAEQGPLAEATARTWLESAAVQEALLPSALPVLPRARVAARYLPAAGEAAGGDWFDAFPLPDGRLALMVGDVAGHGVAAAAAMGQLRAVLRHALTSQFGLATVLAQADRFAASDAARQMATLCLAVLEPENGRFQYATCGHLPPLVAAPDGTARHLPGTGARPLGAVAPGSRAADLAPVLREGVVKPGETLLLYSNGLVQRPGRTLDAGLADLAVVAGDAAANPALAAQAAGTPAERVSQLTVELLTRSGYDDDVTTLAVWRQPDPGPPLAVERTANPEAVAALRRALDGWLEELGIAFGDRQLAALSVTETVTNAVEHAYPRGRPGPVRLDAAVTADGYLETRVSDRGHWRGPGNAEPGIAEPDRGQGLSVALQFAGELQVSHPPQGAGEPPGARGTIVALRHRVHRQPVLGPLSVSPAAPPPPASFAVEPVAAGPAPRVRVTGPVDLTTAERLAGRLLAACRAGTLPLTVDLSGVTILASVGVRGLYRLAAQLAAHGQELTLVSEPGSPAAAVLRLAQLPWSPC
jgi:serine phosphatase RsbU (regulator of sigma subunit)/anti-sigma regulatory factor (Ser/Thr protein kinase)/anti-anti-sigma regulatory factor